MTTNKKNKLKKLLKKIQINFNKNKRPRLLVDRSEYIAEKLRLESKSKFEEITEIKNI